MFHTCTQFEHIHKLNESCSNGNYTANPVPESKCPVKEDVQWWVGDGKLVEQPSGDLQPIKVKRDKSGRWPEGI